MPAMSRKVAVALAASASIALLATACTGQSDAGANDDASKDTTINFWHAWSAPGEVKAVRSLVAGFEKAHPNIHVDIVANMTDDKINQALRAGGDKAPDVISSFTTNNVGKFCSSGALVDLNPFFKKAGVDPATTFPKAMNEYTQFDGNRCAAPLLGDAYGLYYNKTAFKKAGITSPPKTWSEFEKDAKKLTLTKGDSYKQLGFMPNYHGWESTTEHYFAQFSPTYFDRSGKSNVAEDPAFEAGFTLQKKLVDELGGYKKLETYRATLGDEWGPKHPFHTGQVAMQLDGEWRLGMAEEAKPDFEIGVAPLPVPDDRADQYGKGYITGTITGIAATSKKQNAAWELVKYMTTDTDAVVGFANDIHNVPSTLAALKSPKLTYDPRFKTFLDIAADPNSTTTPASVNGGVYLVTIQEFGYAYESGRAKDLKAGLAGTAKQIDTDIAQAK
ncbi:sugar ABC transporter substrate-binding protein [Streptomyces avermitilis]|nr:MULTISPECIES: ABC transporter substrate-binding protein [Streptomyces]KUN52109.1 sugar ABC transporter substrate-binding protein [Streptomyces avermitilis]MYT00967.1 extracellular solute-binding protein [Streptomyces sp. SID5469]OOV30598.1 ABC transporter substrate-binding protein [Streptomyces avermitilis]BAC73095.1 putative multiple sugar ABC transporter substrate-binding protein [Streptomyces avermitilis MA-4680 = NBRC 14893]GDY65530.1 ABC transporter substrate-binding protein [Streptomy